jgi:hypothetical protein
VQIVQLLKSSLRSSSAPAIACFIVFNLTYAILVSRPGEELYDANLRQNSDLFRLLQSDNKVDVVFSGSSVIEIPLSLLDGEHQYIAKPVLPAKILSEQDGKNISVRTYAIEAGLISDQYLLMRELIRLRKAPNMVILALVPRDFSDARLQSPEQSDTFRSLVTLSDLDITPLFLHGFQQNVWFIWRRLVPLYRFRFVISGSITAVLKRLYFPLLPQVPVQSPVDVSTGVGPANKLVSTDETAERFRKSHDEYVNAYSLLNKTNLHLIEYDFLHRFMHLMNASGTYFIVLNMPLTEMNKQLLPPQFYDSFVSEVQSSAKEANAPFVNLDSSKLFELPDYYDAAHLNASGARKLLDAIGPYVRNKFSPQGQSDRKAK